MQRSGLCSFWEASRNFSRGWKTLSGAVRKPQSARAGVWQLRPVLLNEKKECSRRVGFRPTILSPPGNPDRGGAGQETTPLGPLPRCFWRWLADYYYRGKPAALAFAGIGFSGRGGRFPFGRWSEALAHPWHLLGGSSPLNLGLPPFSPQPGHDGQGRHRGCRAGRETTHIFSRFPRPGRGAMRNFCAGGHRRVGVPKKPLPALRAIFFFRIFSAGFSDFFHRGRGIGGFPKKIEGVPGPIFRKGPFKGSVFRGLLETILPFVGRRFRALRKTPTEFGGTALVAWAPMGQNIWGQFGLRGPIDPFCRPNQNFGPVAGSFFFNMRPSMILFPFPQSTLWGLFLKKLRFNPPALRARNFYIYGQKKKHGEFSIKGLVGGGGGPLEKSSNPTRLTLKLLLGPARKTGKKDGNQMADGRGPFIHPPHGARNLLFLTDDSCRSGIRGDVLWPTVVSRPTRQDTGGHWPMGPRTPPCNPLYQNRATGHGR